MSTLTLTQQATPNSPSAGKVVVYFKADGFLYKKNDAGVESLLATKADVGLGNVDNTSDATVAAAVQTLLNKTMPTVNGVALFHQSDIVNGDFKVAQLNTSFAAPASNAYDLDGWFQGNNTVTAVYTVARVAGSTAGRLARQTTITTADAAVAAGDVVFDSTRIEGYDVEKYVGATFTVAFRAKVPVAGIHCVALRNSGTDRSYVKEINFPAANVWQDCSFTVIGGLPTAGTWNYTTGTGLEISFTHMCGTTFQTTPDAWNTGNFVGTVNQINDCATVGNVWALEKVTLNLGTIGAVSEINFQDELARCQRYFQLLDKQQFSIYQIVSGGYALSGLLPVVMKAIPTIVQGTFTVSNITGSPAISAANTASWLLSGGTATATGPITVAQASAAQLSSRL